jgi:hypothetical protein
MGIHSIYNPLTKIKEVGDVSHYIWNIPSLILNNIRDFTNICKQILEHNINQRWILICDCNKLKRISTPSMVSISKIANIICKNYDKSLIEIKIYRPTNIVHDILYKIWPLLPNHIQSIITITN